MPRSVAFSGGGELVWSAFSGPAGQLALLASAPGDPALPTAPLFHDAAPLAEALGRVHVASGEAPDELFALVQVAEPLTALRRTRILGFDAFEAARGATFAPRWTHDLELLVNAPGILASDARGERLVAGVADASRNVVRIDWLDADGALVERVDLAASALKGLVLAEKGERAVLCAGLELIVLERNAVILQRTLGGSTAALALSDDGRIVAHGDQGGVRVLEEDGAGWTTLATFPGNANELPVGLALSADGETLAISWWDYVDTTAVRLEVVDVRTGSIRNAHEQRGAAFGLQNFPSALRMSADGRRVALGLWGAGDERAELLLFERGTSEPVLSVDLPGSVEALDLDRSGTRIAVACKDAHANLFAATGRLLCYDTGERELELVRSARPGGTLELLLRAPEPLRAALFVAGFVREEPLVMPGRGALSIDLRAPHFSCAGTIGPADRASALVPLPAGTSLIGLELGIQAVARESAGWRLVPTLVLPPIL